MSDLPRQAIAAKTSPREDGDQRRLRLLESAALRWLRDAGWPPVDAAAQVRVIEPVLGQWLQGCEPEPWFEQLPSLAHRLVQRLPPGEPPLAGAFPGAFAHSLIAQAIDEVAAEAQRAGHADVFDGLRPYLHGEPTAAERAELCAMLRFSDAALAMALSRLRKRLRERIEATLALWAPDPETRHTLRRQLRHSLIGTESPP